MREDDFIGQAFYWFTGEVQKVNDPKKMNRVKVRCHGYHNANIKDEDLPWAIVMMPSTSQSSKGYGRTHELEEGSWVVGFFRDGMSAQDPLVMGSIATMTDDTIDIPEKASGDDNYPNNKVYKSEGGHIIEIDNGTRIPAVPAVAAIEAVEASEGVEAVEAVAAIAAIAASRSGERIKVTHTGGSYAEIDENGDIYIDNTKSGGDIYIWSKKNITVSTTDGDVEVSTDSGDIEVKAKLGKVDITAAGDITLASVTKTRVM
jgi:hypothetical protein